MIKSGAKNLDQLMWAFALDGSNSKPNIPALKNAVADLVRLMTQKTAGQEAYKKASDLSFDDVRMTINSIAIEAIALVQSGVLDKIGQETEGEKEE